MYVLECFPNILDVLLNDVIINNIIFRKKSISCPKQLITNQYLKHNYFESRCFLTLLCPPYVCVPKFLRRFQLVGMCCYFIVKAIGTQISRGTQVKVTSNVLYRKDNFQCIQHIIYKDLM